MLWELNYYGYCDDRPSYPPLNSFLGDLLTPMFPVGGRLVGSDTKRIFGSKESLIVSENLKCEKIYSHTYFDL